MALAARPTIHRGIPMRSRLEARFAANIDSKPGYGLLEYEPVAFSHEGTQYLPDFRLTHPTGYVAYIEVRPDWAGVARGMGQMEAVAANMPGVGQWVVMPDGDAIDDVWVVFRRPDGIGAWQVGWLLPSSEPAP
jgi:hypothetical protein